MGSGLFDQGYIRHDDRTVEDGRIVYNLALPVSVHAPCIAYKLQFCLLNLTAAREVTGQVLSQHGSGQFCVAVSVNIDFIVAGGMTVGRRGVNQQAFVRPFGWGGEFDLGGTVPLQGAGVQNYGHAVAR